MTNDIARFDQFVSSAPARIEAAQTTDEVQQVLQEAKVLAAAARAAKNREYEEMAKTVEQKALNRLGRMMADQRDAGMMAKAGRPGNNRVNDKPNLSAFGIDKNLAHAARKAYPEGWPQKPKPKPQRMTSDELTTVGRSPKTERYHTESGDVSRIKLIRDELVAAKLRIAELEVENLRLKSDLEAIQTGQIMQMSRAALEQRRAIITRLKTKREKRAAVETVPDEKTKEELERQIQRLKGLLKTERQRVQAFAARGATVLDKEARKTILVCLHPDGVVDPSEKVKREKAFKLFSAAIPEPVF